LLKLTTTGLFILQLYSELPWEKVREERYGLKIPFLFKFHQKSANKRFKDRISWGLVYFIRPWPRKTTNKKTVNNEGQLYTLFSHRIRSFDVSTSFTGEPPTKFVESLKMKFLMMSTKSFDNFRRNLSRRRIYLMR